MPISNVKENFFSCLLYAEVVLLLVPTTVVYVIGLIAAVYLAIGGVLNGDFWMLVLFFILLLPGYGLYSLWWLVSKLDVLRSRNVPVFIRRGLVAGVLSAGFFLLQFAYDVYRYSAISYHPSIYEVLLFGGGPLLVTLTLISIIRSSEPNSGQLGQNPPAEIIDVSTVQREVH